MFNRKPKQQPQKSKDSQILSQSQLQQFKSAFSDVSLSGKDSAQSSQFDLEKVEDDKNRQSQLSMAYSKIKNTFYDLNSRSFAKYAQFSSYLQIKKVIQSRSELHKMNITVNSLECLSVGMCIFVPRKWVIKTLLTLFMLTVHLQILQKFMLNYYIEKIALENNRMQPIEQQARNLIEYKYRIQNLNYIDSKQQQVQPYVQKLLEDVDKKNLEYLKFKKVQLLI